jgi:hypothetical protein
VLASPLNVSVNLVVLCYLPKLTYFQPGLESFSYYFWELEFCSLTKCPMGDLL